MQIEAMERVASLPATLARLAKLLARIPLYHNATFTFEYLQVDEMTPLVHTVIDDRLSTATALLRHYLTEGFEPFEPVLVRDSLGWHIIAPPAIEIDKCGAWVQDGSHRLFAAWRFGLKGARVLAIRDCNRPQASTSFSWLELRVANENICWKDRCARLDLSLFRPVSAILREMARQQYCLEQNDPLITEAKKCHERW
jgi:hypothetical protein